MLDMNPLVEEMLRHSDPAQVPGLSRFFKTGPGQYGEGVRFLPVRREGPAHDGAGSAADLRARMAAGEDWLSALPGEAQEVFNRVSVLRRRSEWFL